MGGAVSIYKALSNPNRLIVYQIICKKGVKGEGITIEQICAAAKMKQPAVSHHVARLAAAGLVDRKKSQWWVHCSPSSDALELMRRFWKEPADFVESE
ncbi:MAG TPA: MarR family transcriptional regulator [Planctomycetota bacterium]|nr:MarR family transcriptional regulator [Planctomycetota bacterium]